MPTKANYHSCLKQITAMDIDRYLVGDILNKVDMASMANSLETRAPFLDVRLAEFGYHLSDKEKISGNESKLILKRFCVDIFLKLIRSPKDGIWNSSFFLDKRSFKRVECGLIALN